MTPYQHYQLLLRFERTLSLRPILDEVIQPGMRVLDAGCGLGLLSLWAARQGAQVLAVDLGDVNLARALAEENGLASQIEFRQANLFDLVRSDDSLRNSFDVVIAMIYWNDPRRDEGQSNLASQLRRSFLRRGGTLIPDRVRYSAAPVEWADYDWNSRCTELAVGLQAMSLRYDLQFSALASELRQSCFKEDFPARLASGMLARDGCRWLGGCQPQFTLDYAADASNYPDAIRLTIDSPGTMTGVLWQQQLMFRDRLIFANESLSWVDPVVQVSPQQVGSLPLDSEWRRSSVLRWQEAESR